MNQPGAGSAKYFELYTQSHRQAWDPLAIELAQDRRDWERIQQEHAVEAYGEQIHRLCSLFFEGEESVAKTLAPYLSAVERAGLGSDKALCLASQLYEEARHYVFFARYFADVLGDLDTKRHLAPAPKSVLVDALTDISTRLRREEDPERLEVLLVEGAVRYMGIAEAMLARTGYRGAEEALLTRGWLPGLQQGFRLIRRDEGRHVSFGIHFLQEIVERQPSYGEVVQSTFHAALPDVLATVKQFDGEHALVDLDSLLRYAVDAGRQFMTAAGLGDDEAAMLDTLRL